MRNGIILDELTGNHGAVMSDDKIFRYLLWRRLSEKVDSRKLLVIGLNPSTADAEKNDPTIRRCVGFARDLGYSSIWVVNLFSYRATHPVDLKKASDPIGPETDNWISGVSTQVESVIVAWGNHGFWRGRHFEVLNLLNNPHSLSVTKKGAPAHPLYLRKGLFPQPFVGETRTKQ